MPDLDLTITRRISAQIIACLVGKLPLTDFDAWVQQTPELRSLLSPGDYAELMSIDFQQIATPSLLDKLLRGYIDWAQYEKEQLAELLMAIIWKDNVPAALAELHEHFTHGLTFLDVLGNEYGLAVKVAQSPNAKPGADLDTIMKTIYPKARLEAKRLLACLMAGKIEFTGTYTQEGYPLIH